MISSIIIGKQDTQQPSSKKDPFSEVYVIDTVKAAIHGQEGTEIVTLSDVSRPALTGNIRTLDEIIFERSVFLDAKKMKFNGDDDAVDKYISAIARENNLSQNDIEKLFTEVGYTYAEGREQLQIMQSFNNMLDFKIRSNLIIPRKQVIEYWQNNPVWQDARYYISYTSVPFGKDKEVTRNQLIDYIKTRKSTPLIRWSSPFWIDQSDIAQDKQSIISLQKGEIAGPVEQNGYFELYRLEDMQPARLLTLDERYQEIVGILRRPLLESKMADYRDSLFNSVSIVYF